MINEMHGGTIHEESRNNLISDPDSSGGLTKRVDGNIVGQDDGTGSRVLLPLNQILNPTLADNCGPTLTHALGSGSIAINAGSNENASDDGSLDEEPLVNDQRGLPRVVPGRVDISAFQRQGTPQAFISLASTTHGRAVLRAPSKHE